MNGWKTNEDEVLNLFLYSNTSAQGCALKMFQLLQLRCAPIVSYFLRISIFLTFCWI